MSDHPMASTQAACSSAPHQKGAHQLAVKVNLSQVNNSAIAWPYINECVYQSTIDTTHCSSCLRVQADTFSMQHWVMPSCYSKAEAKLNQSAVSQAACARVLVSSAGCHHRLIVILAVGSCWLVCKASVPNKMLYDMLPGTGGGLADIKPATAALDSRSSSTA